MVVLYSYVRHSNHLLDAASASSSFIRRSCCDTDLANVGRLLSRLKDGENQLRCIRATVSRERNTYTRVNELPVELLQLIFEYYGATSTHMEDRRITHPALTVASVCTYWRTVALKHSALWSRINLSSPPRLLECCGERAKRHPLTLSFVRRGHDGGGDSRFGSRHALNFLSGKFHQTVDLAIDLVPAEPELWLLLKTTNAPLLQRCVVHSGESEVEVLSRPLFGDSAPQLRHLELHGLCLPWNTTYLGNLSTLVMSCDALALSHETEMHLLLAALPSMRHLDLRILSYSTKPSGVASAPSSTPRAVMPHLHTLKLQMGPELMHYILSSITAPSVHTLEMMSDSINADEAEVVATLCRPDVLPPGVLSRVTQLGVKLFRQGSSSAVLVEGFLELEHTDRVFQLGWAWRSSASVDMRILRQISSDIQRYHLSSSLRTVNIDAGWDLHKDIALGGLLHQPSLRCITFKGGHNKAFLTDLTDTAVPQAVNGQPGDIKLTIHGCHFSTDTLNALLRWCNRHPVRSLDLRDMVFFVASKDAIENVVRSIFHLAEDVKWDLGCSARFYCLDEGARCYFVKEIKGNIECGQTYMVEGLRDEYSHRFVISR